MNENALSIAIKQALDIGFANFVTLGLVPVAPITKLRHQPNVQGLPTPVTIFWTQVAEEEYGFLKRSDLWDSVNNIMVHSEEQPVITTLQFNSTLIQNPVNPMQLTAKDYLNFAKSILQSDVTRLALQAQSIQVLRVKGTRQTYWIDDKKRQEADPSFDLDFAHTSIIVTATPSTTSLNTGLYPV